MRFDDRLRTVLALPAADPHDRSVRWRQLVELVARADGDADTDLVQEAIAEIRKDLQAVPERVRSSAALAIAQMNIPAELVSLFASDALHIAAPVLASARLTASEWKHVTETASDECRSFIAAMRAEQPQAPPAPTAPIVPPPQPDRDSGPPTEIPSISEVVARIERLQRSREDGEDAPPAPPEEDQAPRLFRWECNDAGAIDWVEGAPRGAIVGQSIAQSGLGTGVDRRVERAFAARTPFHDGVLEVAPGGTAGGTWKISGVPAFERISGRFAGYRGVAERSPDTTSAVSRAPDPDSLRELAHEIKTPLNAIIGFAEIITGEYLGPAESRYRQRADEIVAQARLLLTAIEDLDFAARLQSRDDESRANLSDCLARSWEDIERAARERGVDVALETTAKAADCALDPELTQRLAERFCLAAIGCARRGEGLCFRVGSDAGSCTLSVNRPDSLRDIDLRPGSGHIEPDGKTLPLRLVMGLARTAGGELDSSGYELRLRLPKA